LGSSDGSSDRRAAEASTREDELLGVVDHLARLGRLDHQLDDLLDAGLAAGPVARDRLVEVVLGAPPREGAEVWPSLTLA
jgi:hypothetical protein